MEAQPISRLAKRELLKAIPSTVRVAKDVVVCLDAKTGKRLWKTEAPGEPTGRKSSSTPAWPMVGCLPLVARTSIAWTRKVASGSGRRHYPSAARGRRPLSWSMTVVYF